MSTDANGLTLFLKILSTRIHSTLFRFSMSAKQPNSSTSPAHLSKAELKQISQLPLDRLFREIYQKQLWGAVQGLSYYSGSGSRNPVIARPYLESVVDFLKSLEARPVVVDLGCGDFFIGSQIFQYAKHYFACDVVPDLIEALAADHRADNLDFLCLDATSEPLPSGDVLIVRQVLQHLSNNAIMQITRQFHQYRYILLTEHVPMGDFIANKDKPNGPDTRLRWQSGIDLLQAPFNLKVKNARLFCQTEDIVMPSTVIKTMLYEM